MNQAFAGCLDEVFRVPGRFATTLAAKTLIVIAP
jgi:hypothetical protein